MSTSGERQARLLGQIQLEGRAAIDLAQEKEPLVLMFATYTCRSCRDEAKRLVDFFRAKQGLPKNTRFLTVLVGGSFDSVARWKNRVCDSVNAEECVSWEAGIMDSDDLFLERCLPERVTPCVLTQNLHMQPPVVKTVGEKTIQSLEEETGPWEF